ncbi:hypothetical protein MKK88_01850 [Methylobacterium sp. E-005]|uniref:hypothetical protein n=1 Tax=Methylobacterium sp. E-005 TaxID=2836549 RepID=UPI001FBBACEE|nr:hypothetical protein [Methylobacterium sp. E-005]MCJ2084738.1 hypothetical protein [Methylobacterium sp. E-005]
MSPLLEAAVAERCPSYPMFLRKPFKIFYVIDIIADLLDTRDEHEKSINVQKHSTRSFCTDAM